MEVKKEQSSGGSWQLKLVLLPPGVFCPCTRSCASPPGPTNELYQFTDRPPCAKVESVMSLVLSVLMPIVLCLISVYLFVFFKKKINFESKLSWIPGPSSLPILGNYYDLVSATPEDAFKTLYKYYKQYGKTYKVWIGSTPMVYCQDLDIIQDVFKQEDKTCRPSMYTMAGEFVGPGLLFGEADEIWKMLRRVQTESFHSDILELNIDVTTRCIRRLMKELETQAAGGNRPVDLVKLTKPYFLDISLESIAGVNWRTAETSACGRYLRSIDSMCDIIMARLFAPLLKFRCIFNLTSHKTQEDKVKRDIRHFMKTIVSARSNSFQDDESGKRRILADVMLRLQKTSNSLTQTDVENHVSNHILASYDTLATITSLLLFLLGNDPHVQDQVVQELDAVRPDVLTQGLELKHVNSLKLLDRCLKEALRMFPPAPFIGRRLLKPFNTKGGTLPAGLDVYTNLYTYHRNELVYPEPDRFQPDRFLPERTDQRHPLSWIPFGLGMRSCIGQKAAMLQAKVAVAMILKKFRVISYEKTQDLKLSANLVMKSEHGVRVYLQERPASPQPVKTAF